MHPGGILPVSAQILAVYQACHILCHTVHPMSQALVRLEILLLFWHDMSRDVSEPWNTIRVPHILGCQMGRDADCIMVWGSSDRDMGNIYGYGRPRIWLGWAKM